MKNLSLLRKKNNLTQIQFAKLFGVSTSTVAMWETGQRKPDYHTIVRLCNFFNTDFYYLVGNQPPSFLLEPETHKIPLLGFVQAGVPTYAEEHILGYENVTENLARDKNIFALKVKGDSMEPKISNDDIVIVRRQSTIEDSQIAVVLIGTEEATVKKVVKQKDGITIVPFNPDFTPIYYSNKQCEELPVTIEGVVIELRRKFNF